MLSKLQACEGYITQCAINVSTAVRLLEHASLNRPFCARWARLFVVSGDSNGANGCFMSTPIILMGSIFTNAVVEFWRPGVFWFFLWRCFRRLRCGSLICCLVVGPVWAHAKEALLYLLTGDCPNLYTKLLCLTLVLQRILQRYCDEIDQLRPLGARSICNAFARGAFEAGLLGLFRW